MKKKLTLFLFFVSLWSFGQQYSLPSKLVDQYVVAEKSKDIFIESSIDKDNFYEISLKYRDSIESFKLKPLTFPNFEVKFKNALLKVIAKHNDTSLLDTAKTLKKEDIQNDIAYVFTQLITYYNTQEEQPEVATLFLKKDIPIYYENENKEIEKLDLILEDVDVELSFFGGFIEKIQVNGKVNGIPMSFNNKYSIGISSTKNITELSDYAIYSNEKINATNMQGLKKMLTKKEFEAIAHTQTSFEKHISEIGLDSLKDNQKQSFTFERMKDAFMNNNYKSYFQNTYKLFIPNSQVKKRKNLVSLMLYLDDVIRYVKKVDVNANDISPVPQLVLLDSNQTQTKLFREESSKLFEAVVYTDFLGVFDEENPNGIIQTEVHKKFNLNTKRYDTPGVLFEGVGILQSFDAQFQFSKIEKNNKFLLPAAFDVLDDTGTVTETIPYYSPIALLQYRNFAIGGMLNLITLENQNAKMNMFFDLGFLFGRSGIKEAVDQVEGTFVNHLEVPFEAKLQLLPEKRISFSISDKLSWFEIFDSKIPLYSIENSLLENKNRFINSFNVDLALDVSTNGKLFLRYKLIHELDNINTNFSQLQFGYSFYLLQKNGTRKTN